MIYLIMGVLGSGKTTIGVNLAKKLGCDVRDGDDYHPQANRDKMAKGLPLTDGDREPWLAAIRKIIDSMSAMGSDLVVTCSALKVSYRRTLVDGLDDIKLIYLKGPRKLVAERLKKRRGHFVDPELLDSQFQTLEEPRNAIVVDISKPPDEIVEDILSYKL
jgi:gluconokinase